ncbi:MAG: hypothetical protein KME26_20555 [Oscillatoria princeps RMCB-10]|nr:hypothetical protein [Oscillatoria princeps RMCB-10]
MPDCDLSGSWPSRQGYLTLSGENLLPIGQQIFPDLGGVNKPTGYGSGYGQASRLSHVGTSVSDVRRRGVTPAAAA